MAASFLLVARSSPLNRCLLLRHLRLFAQEDVVRAHHRYCCATAMAAGPAKPEEKLSPLSSTVGADSLTSTAEKMLESMEPRKDNGMDDPDYRKWKDKEEEISRDIEPIVTLAKEILHSKKYLDGEHLSIEDERAVVEKLLAYHPHSEDKIGCGLDSIIVDRHPQFRQSRCLFVVRTDGLWIDFSYQKCLRSYIRLKYPSYAERFIQEHYKRGSG
ncbi:hypothetical protein MLD38_012963 [Melastoma candidum]|uniref:Uncharacterized protein n=1 Tax=Melastoma candidum TaxID=119954 RepID=A0ACB9RC86_9MYRT|nr:hypothetical protein MLD38_012963 [Melastoma candidum]